MSTALEVTILLFVAVAATGVVMTRDPRPQVITLSFYGVLLGLLFFIFQAPDVALSQIVVGAVALPLMFMLALARIRRNEEEKKEKEAKGEHGGAQ